MKVVAFEGQGGARLGVVEGDQVIDLQAVDGKVPADLGEWLKGNNGDVKPLADIAKRAGASARAASRNSCAASLVRADARSSASRLNGGQRAPWRSASGWRRSAPPWPATARSAPAAASPPPK